MFNVEAVWNGTLEEDLDKEVAKIKRKIPSALRCVGSEMVQSLGHHIMQDVYQRYNPHGTDPYIRRLDYNRPSSLIGQEEAIQPSVKGTTLTLAYNPHGEQKQTKDPKYGDDLIRRIETGEGYTWAHQPGARPFWQNFVDEQVDEKIILNFISGMSPYAIEEEGNDVEAEETDYVSDRQSTQTMFDLLGI